MIPRLSLFSILINRHREPLTWFSISFLFHDVIFLVMIEIEDQIDPIY